MQRGVITFTAPQLALSLQALQSSPQDVSLLVNKLTDAQSLADQQPEVEISEEDADTLLDSLPAPQQGEDANITGLRKSLQAFLQQSRGTAPEKQSFLSKLNPFGK